MTNAPTISHWSGYAVSEHKNERTRKLVRTMVKTIGEYELIGPGDHVLVAVSGGKDSYALADFLWRAKQRAPFQFDVTAVHLDQVQPDYDGAPLKKWLEGTGMPFQILQLDTYSVVVDKTKPGGTYCSLCSRLRRGVLYTAAEKLGCNKIALGHHRDDALETLLLNLFYAGKLQAMPAKYVTDDKRFEVIRPLIECAESELAAHAERTGYAILPCNLCGSQAGLKRDVMTKLLTDLEGKIPDVRNVMLHAIKNVQPSHLLDKDVIDVWKNRPEHIRDRTPGPAAESKFLATTLFERKAALPMLGMENAPMVQPDELGA
jgi:tRNA 2-thiocytidine biosynthesis protein TtcA